MDLRPLDRRALEQTTRVVCAVTADDLDRPTPCAGWDLGTLLRHMVAHNNGFTIAATGQPADPAVWDGGDLGTDPAAAFAESAARVTAAFADEQAQGRVFEVHGFGRFSAQQAIRMHFIDYLVHGWDVARSIGADYLPDEELSEVVLRIGQSWPEGAPTIWGPGAPFDHPVRVPADAPASHRMLAFLGRSPHWPA